MVQQVSNCGPDLQRCPHLNAIYLSPAVVNAASAHDGNTVSSSPVSGHFCGMASDLESVCGDTLRQHRPTHITCTSNGVLHRMLPCMHPAELQLHTGLRAVRAPVETRCPDTQQRQSRDRLYS